MSRVAVTSNGTFLRHDDGRVELRPPATLPARMDWTRESWSLIQDLLREPMTAATVDAGPRDGTGSPVEVSAAGGGT